MLEIGKDDSGRLVGLADAAKLLEDLPNKIRDILGIVPEVDRLTENGKDYLRITVQPYPNPISYKGQYHVRSGSTKQELKGSELDHFLLGKYGRRWDGVPLPGVKASDLDPKLLERFRRRAVHSRRLNAEDLPTDDTALLDMLRLTEGNYLKRAAVLLFHADPERFITGAFVKIGDFLNDAEIRYQDEVHGDLFTQVDQTVASIREHGGESRTLPEPNVTPELLEQLRRDRVLTAEELGELSERHERMVEAKTEETFSGHLRRAIHRSGRLVRDIAADAGVPSQLLCEFLEGQRTLRSDVLDRSAQAVQTTISVEPHCP